jgi:hypothetical protein
MTYEGETRGYDLPDFLNAIDHHTDPYRVYNYVLVNNGPFDKSAMDEGEPERSSGDGRTWVIDEKNARLVQYDLQSYADASFKVLARDVVNPAYPIRHDTKKLAAALVDILKEG